MTFITSMTFNGFTEEDFNSFHIDGLEARMEAIRTRIQPKFSAIAAELVDDIAVRTGTEQFLHIAKHARRKVNAPVDTWMAVAHNKRGYKQHPHFQVGLFDDRVFLWLAFIYELPNKKEIAARFLEAHQMLMELPETFDVSFDHMKKESKSVKEMSEQDWIRAIERFRDVQKAELLIGRTLPSTRPAVKDGKLFLELAKETFGKLTPLYSLAMQQAL